MSSAGITVLGNKFIPSDFLPIGFLGYLPYAAIPAGWLVRDGAIYNIADYPELAAKLGTRYGGDGTTTFAVPDDRGLFERGLDLGTGYDSGRVLGSEQSQDVQPHTHLGQVSQSQTSSNASYASIGGTGGSTYVMQSIAANTGTETRPKNRAYIPIIKAKNIYYDMTIQGGNAASLGGNPASYYAANSLVAKYTDFTGSFAANGYRKLPDGTIIQWGQNVTSSGSCNVTFPVVFTSAVYSILATPHINGNVMANASLPTVTGFSGYTHLYTGAPISATFCWLAIGR